MKSVLMFTMAACPFCRKAVRYMEGLMEETPRYKDIPLKMIDETLDPDTADKYDYYYVPTYYVDEEKVHEGEATKDDIRRVFEAAEEE